MKVMIAASRMAQDFAEPYRRLTDHTVVWQERNVKFLQALIEGGVRAAQHQTEANLALTQELFEKAEEQRETLQSLTRRAAEAYWGLAFSAAGYVGGGESRGVAVEEPSPEVASAPFPIPGYAKLTRVQAIEKLDGLSLEELKKVRAYEMEHKNRKSLLAELERRI